MAWILDQKHYALISVTGAQIHVRLRDHRVYAILHDGQWLVLGQYDSPEAADREFERLLAWLEEGGQGVFRMAEKGEGGAP